MPHDFQIVVDCANPHPLADWWAEALGWEVEQQDVSFIEEMISKGQATEADTTHHQGKLVWRAGAAIVKPASDTVADRRMLFQLVPEPKVGKNRLHLDVFVGADNVTDERTRLEAMGATFLHSGRQGPHTWATMADPEGNEFCLA